MSATATTSISGNTVTVHAVSKIGGVNLLGGLIAIDSIVTDVTSTSSNGGDAVVSGGSKIVGATLAKQPITIDASGVQLGKSKLALPKSLTSSINTLLAKAGIKISFSGPVATPSAGALASGGLRIDFDESLTTVPGFTALLDALPPIPSPLPAPAPTPSDVIQALKARHVGGIELGRGEVSLTTTGAGSVVGADDTNDFNSGLSDGLGGFSDATLPGVSSLVPGLPPTLRPTTPASTTAPASPFGAGIGGLLLLALLVQPFFGEALARLSNAVLGPAGADQCDSEGL
jgi:hypothetical protein